MSAVARSAAPASDTTPGVHDAVDRWARSVFGAPSRLGELVTAVHVRDEILERVVTEIVRRDVREERLPTNQRRVSSPRLRASDVDPFSVPAESLRAESEHVAHCGYCNGAGTCHCGACGGARRGRCITCSGRGKVLKQYKKSSSWIACSVCRGGGTVACGGCGGTGSVTCSGCSGSGHQLVWLIYDQRSRWTVQVEPRSPVVDAHRELAEARFLDAQDLDAFSIVAMEKADGPVVLGGYRDTDRPILQAAAASLDPRLERVNRQQYVSFGVVRRDASYAMCGTSGEIVLSGKGLVASHTPRSVRPIQIRLAAWMACVASVGTATALGLAKLRGASAYFARSNAWLTLAWCIGIALAIPAIGAALRSVRPGFRWAPLRRFERYVAGASVVAFTSMLALGCAARPRSGEVDQALAAGDVHRARLVVGALRETKGPTPDVAEADDAVLLAEANELTGEARWKLLDDVAARGGTKARAAALIARTERLLLVKSLLDRNDAQGAIAALDRGFPAPGSDAEVAAARARAYDAAGASCADDPCRVRFANGAAAAEANGERSQRAADARRHLLDSLRPSDISGEVPIARLVRLRAVATTAAKSIEVAPADAEIVDRAKTAGAWAQTERAKVPLIGSDPSVAEELLGGPATADGKSTWIAVEGARVYLVLDPRKTCRGVYAVGGKPGARTLHGALWPADRILSQAVGHAAVVRKPTPDTATLSRWSEGGISVVARWDNGEPEELRVGDAAP